MRRGFFCILSVLMTGCLGFLSSCAWNHGPSETVSGIKADAMDDPYGTDSDGLLEAMRNSGEVVVYLESGSSSGKDSDFSDYFSKYYNGTFVRRYCPSDDEMTLFLQDYYSGKSPDVLRLNESYWPRAALTGTTYTLGQLEQLGVLGLDHPSIRQYRELTAASFAFNGECYAVSADFVSPAMIAVNEDLFDSCVVRSPSLYYKDGDWNGDTFLRCCHEVARTLQNGTSLYACNRFNPLWVLLSNDADPIVLDGWTVNSSLTTPAALHSLARSRTFLTSVSLTEDKDAFARGELAMLCGTADELADVLVNCTFRWDVVPFPYGSDNTSGRTPGTMTAWAVSSASQNVQGAVNFILARRLFEDFYYNIDESAVWSNPYVVYNDRQQRLVLSMAYMVRMANYPYIGDLSEQSDRLWSALEGDEPIFDIASRFGEQIEEQAAQALQEAQSRLDSPQ